MTVFIGGFAAALQHLPQLERICDEHGGAIMVTQKGISYELPARAEEQGVVLQMVKPISAEIWETQLRQAA